MNLRRLSSLLFFSAALSTAPAISRADPMTRERAVSEAVRQNPQIAAARARRAAAEALVSQADAARWPAITVEVGMGPSQGASLVKGTAVDSTRSRYDFFAQGSAVVGGSIDIVQPLYTFGKIDSSRAAADHGLKARDAMVRATQGDIALEVGRLYESLLLAREATRLGEELQNYLERTVIATEQRLNANVPEITEKDVLRVQSALALTRISLHEAQSGEAQARAGLAAYLGLASDEIEPQEDALSPITGNPAASARMVAEGLTHRPELTALENAARAYDALAAAERARYLPDIVVLASATGAYTPGRDLVTSRYVIDPLNTFVPVLLLGARWQLQGNTASARADEQAAQAEEERDLAAWARQGVPAQVKKAQTDLERADRDMAESRDGIGRAKQWMVRANADYVAGLGDSLSLVDATRAYAELRVAGLDATFRHNVALAELAHATGTIVSDSLGLYPGAKAP